MPGLRLSYQTIEFGDSDIHLCTLRDKQEFQDDDGEAEALGISSAMWSLFGVVWESSRALARLMVDIDIKGRRILEVGCGIGLASLVLNGRAADITASDQHPEAAAFLRRNVLLNGGPSIPFVQSGWGDEAGGAGEALGVFDLIIGSDLLYERGQVDALAAFIDLHGRPSCEVILVDPGRDHGNHFRRRIEAQGYTTRDRALAAAGEGEPAFHGRAWNFVRQA